MILSTRATFLLLLVSLSVTLGHRCKRDSLERLSFKLSITPTHHELMKAQKTQKSLLY